MESIPLKAFIEYMAIVGQKGKDRLLLNAYRTADAAKQGVFLIVTPRETMEYKGQISYIVLESEADEWERSNGAYIQYRISRGIPCQ